MIDGGVRIDIPIDEERYQDIVRPIDWYDNTEKMAQAFRSRVVYEGPIAGLAAGRVLQLTIGNSDSDIRIAIDAVPHSLTTPVLAAGRSVARVLGSGTSDRREMLRRIAVLLHIVEPQAEAFSYVPDRPTFGYAAALRLVSSPARPRQWEALRASISEFEPSLVVDLRDGGSALETNALGLLVNSFGSGTEIGMFSARHVFIGADEGGRIAQELRRRGVKLLNGDTDDARMSGLFPISPGVLVSIQDIWSDCSLASYSVHAAGSIGLTAVAVGRVEYQRAFSLAAAAGSVLATGPAAVRPEVV